MLPRKRAKRSGRYCRRRFRRATLSRRSKPQSRRTASTGRDLPMGARSQRSVVQRQSRPRARGDFRRLRNGPSASSRACTSAGRARPLQRDRFSSEASRSQMCRRPNRNGGISRPVAWSCRRLQLPSPEGGVGAASFDPSSLFKLPKPFKLPSRFKPPSPFKLPKPFKPPSPFKLPKPPQPSDRKPAREKFALICALASMKSGGPWPIAA